MIFFCGFLRSKIGAWDRGIFHGVGNFLLYERVRDDWVHIFICDHLSFNIQSSSCCRLLPHVQQLVSNGDSVFVCGTVHLLFI
jgi:hypothetical protein